MARHSKFQNFVCSLPYADPDAMLGHFLPEMQAAAYAAGASIESVANIVIDGNRHYLPSIDGKNDQKQYYVANLKIDKDSTVWPAVTFGSFYPHYDNQYFKPRDLVWSQFQAAKTNNAIVEDAAAVKAYNDRLKAVRAEARRQKEAHDALVRDAQEAARQAAIEAWGNAVPISDLTGHSYIAKKNMETVYGDVRVAVQSIQWTLYIHKYSEWRTVAVCNAGDLLIPAWDGDPKTPGIANIQRIDQNGTKRFLAGGKISETYHLIQGNDSTILTAEGWATGQTVRHLSGNTVVVAWSGGNMPFAATLAQDRFVGKPVVPCCDNDFETCARTGKNPGVIVAGQLLDNHGLYSASPEFDTSLDFGCSDWDDKRIKYGNDIATKELNAAIRKASAMWLRKHDLNFIHEEQKAATELRLSPAEPDKSYAPLNKQLNNFDAFEDRDGNGKPKGTLSNIVFMLRQYGICVRYNKISKDVEVDIPSRGFSRDNRLNASLEEIRNLCELNGITKDGLDGKLSYIGEVNSYNPIEDWFKARPWDGVSRIKDFLDTVVVEDSYDKELKDTLILRWLIGAVALAHNDGSDKNFMMKGVLVFQGEQSKGKTSWFKRLVGGKEADYLMDGLHLDPSDKDSVLTACSHFIVELGELDASFRKSDIARLKAFLTRATDRLRRPFDRKDSFMPRRTSFFASVNDEKYLVDQTGNTRWWTVRVKSLNYQHTIDMQQLWAEIYVLWQSGEQHWLKPEEEAKLNGSNLDFEMVDPLEEAVMSAFEVTVSYDENGARTYEFERSQHMSSTEVLRYCGYDKPKNSDATKMGSLLSKMFGSAKRTSTGRRYHLPAFSSSSMNN